MYSRSRPSIISGGYNSISCLSSLISFAQKPSYFSSAYCPNPRNRLVFSSYFFTKTFLRASSLCFLSSQSRFSSSSFFLFQITSSNYFLMQEGPAYLELVIGTADVELAILFLAIDSSMLASDFFTLKSSLNCYSSSLLTPNFFANKFEIALLFALQ